MINGTFLLSLHREIDIIMGVAKEIMKRIATFPDDFVFTASDFDFALQSQATVVKLLNRMAKLGVICKTGKG